MKKILVTGGDGRFASVLKNSKSKFKFIYLNKKQLNICNLNSIFRAFKKYKPSMLLHLAGLSRPMDIHEKDITKSINLNIIGTANLVNACSKFNIKIIYFSTSYIYPGKKGGYKETDPLLPWNNYGWSKLGGESSVQMYKNSLILRCCMTEQPFIHKKAYANVKSNFIFHKDLVKIFLKTINKYGIFNMGGKSKTIYSFAKKYNPDIKKTFSDGKFPLRQDMSLNKIYKALK
jgi:dTDP-4-dehydrorhamnose reductase|tara:strand:+ start:48 stop:743 length:696 start_codon:yes stop_codon:yes gene_type:complete